MTLVLKTDSMDMLKLWWQTAFGKELDLSEAFHGRYLLNMDRDLSKRTVTPCVYDVIIKGEEISVYAFEEGEKP